jgi:hypothetical protein|tara:strand:+ start:515 stop:721 length:207 start_codon:yes stop_codon:yes gene_type:complete
MQKLKERKVDIKSAEIEDVDFKDYPDFCDAFISSMDWDDGTEMTDNELETWCDNNQDAVYDIVYDSVF